MTNVSVAKWGNSLALRLPKHVADLLSIRSGTVMALEVQAGRFVATPVAARPRPKLAELVKQITRGNRHSAMNWGGPVGIELL